MKRGRLPLLFLVVLAGLMLLPALALADGGSDTQTYEKYAEKGLGLAALVSFGFGVAASLTPCVFPMVPITVSIFGATEAKRGRGMALSGTFVLGIAALFTPLGVLSALSGTLMGAALANTWVVLGISVLFLVLASSMFGAFEMALPSGLTNRLSTVGGVGFRGAFVLGLVMGLIAAPCTGPFLTGMIAWIATTKNVAVGALSMFSFSLGLGVPFFVAGGLAVSLPKGGAWMLGIKWGSGVLLAYMALSYLRDKFGFIRGLTSPSPVYGAVAAVVLIAGLVLGTVHILAERRRSKLAHLSKPMKLASIIPAVAGAFMFVSWFNMPKSRVIPEAGAAQLAPEIVWQGDEVKARAQADTEKKPVLIDFGAEWCTACKELEHNTWPDPLVREQAVRFIAIKVDATDDDAPEIKRLQKKYNVIGLPTVVVLDATGKERVRYTEFVTADKFAAAIKDVR
jgi:thioredoxin:protein disulfide reductase